MKTLSLILAGGDNKGVEALINEDQPVKPMIKVGDKRMIEFALDSVQPLEVDIAVTTHPSKSFDVLDDFLKERGIRVVKQGFERRAVPSLFELPFILSPMYHNSLYSEILQGYDSIMTLPSDLEFHDIDFRKMLDMHYENLGNLDNKQITVLSKRTISGGHADLFKMDGDRIKDIRSYELVGQTGPILDYEATTQAGVYIFSRGMLRNLRPTLNSWKIQEHVPVSYWLSQNKVLRYVTEGDWVDYGNAENILHPKPYVPPEKRT